jgi:predicted nucleic acid-binding Zn ribbon protein
MPVEIAQHGHCHVCGRVVQYGEATCSDKCKAELERTRKGRKRTMIILYVILIFFLLFMIVGPLLGGN